MSSTSSNASPRSSTARRWLRLAVLSVAALAPSAWGQTYAVVATDYQNLWYPQGSNGTPFAPVSTLCYGGSGPGNSPTNSSSPAGLVISESQFGMAAGAI